MPLVLELLREPVEIESPTGDTRLLQVPEHRARLRSLPVQRTIRGFHQDEQGDWVAELDCGHTQHVRHAPPFQVRPWVLSADERAARIGSLRDCPLCDRERGTSV